MLERPASALSEGDSDGSAQAASLGCRGICATAVAGEKDGRGRPDSEGTADDPQPSRATQPTEMIAHLMRPDGAIDSQRSQSSSDLGLGSSGARGAPTISP